MAPNTPSDTSEGKQGFTVDSERIENLFKTLDTNGDGRIDADELAEGLRKLGFHRKPGQAAAVMKQGDQNSDGHMSFEEFLKYITEHEKKLYLVFQKFDKNGSGDINADEIQHAFASMGVSCTKQEAEHYIKRMDVDKSLKVSWKEWREYHMFNPSGHTVHDVVQFWKHNTIIDIGEDMRIPDEFTEEEKITGVWWKQLVAGGGAGVVSRTCTAPFDRLKVLLQVKATASNNLGIRSGWNSMIREGGYISLWRGNGVNVIKIAPESAIKFFAYEKAKKLFGSDSKQLAGYERMIAGSMAGVTSQTCIYPLEVLKTRLAMGKTGQYNGLVHAAKVIFQKEGILSFYRGLTPSLLGIVPYAGIDLAIYETLKNSWLQYHKDESANPGVFVLLACGTTSSTCGQLASYPLALIRTKLQAKARIPGDPKTLGALDLFNIIIQNEGVKGLYRGITPNFIKVAPAVAISYAVYENLRTAFGII